MAFLGVVSTSEIPIQLKSLSTNLILQTTLGSGESGEGDKCKDMMPSKKCKKLMEDGKCEDKKVAKKCMKTCDMFEGEPKKSNYIFQV